MGPLHLLQYSSHNAFYCHMHTHVQYDYNCYELSILKVSTVKAIASIAKTPPHTHTPFKQLYALCAHTQLAANEGKKVHETLSHPINDTQKGALGAFKQNPHVLLLGTCTCTCTHTCTCTCMCIELFCAILGNAFVLGFCATASHQLHQEEERHKADGNDYHCGQEVDNGTQHRVWSSQC